MNEIKITAKYISEDGWIDQDNPTMIYSVRELHESNSGRKTVHLWGFNDSVDIKKVELMINGKIVKWIK